MLIGRSKVENMINKFSLDKINTLKMGHYVAINRKFHRILENQNFIYIKQMFVNFTY